MKPVTPANLLQRIEWVLDDDRPFEPCGDIYRQEMHLPGRNTGGKRQEQHQQPRDMWAID